MMSVATGTDLVDLLTQTLAPFSLGGSELHSIGISSAGHCRWLLPSNVRAAGKVLSAWRPYGHVSWLKWQAVRSLAALSLTRAPGLSRLPGLPLTNAERLGFEAETGPLHTVAYISRPGPRQKMVCTLVDAHGRPALVLKVPMTAAAGSALAHEAAVLRQLARAHPDLSVPRTAGLHSGLFAQTVIRGRPSDGRLLPAHAHFLASLRNEGETLDLVQFAASLVLQLPIPGAVQSWLASLSGTVPSVFLHGDFAPWNLLILENGDLAALDWEDAIPAGLPVWDIAHFHLQQAYLLGIRGKPLTQMEANPAYGLYLDRLGLSRAQGRDLFHLYCLATASRIHDAGEAKQSGYLMAQLLAGVAR